MKRRALIIGNPGETGAENYCEGVNRDLENYPRFLQTAYGGVWNKHDIEILKRPRVQAVRDAIAKVRDADYSLVVFTGHGYHLQPRDSTILELKKDEEIDSAELRRGAAKQTLVLDCCRKVYRQVTIAERAIFKAMAAPTLHPQHCRYYYNKQIEECFPGLIVINSCTVGQTAGDASDKGGWYSYSFIQGAEAWVENNSINTDKEYDVMSVVSAHGEACRRVSNLSGGRQDPQIEKPRSEKYFPFCIVA